MIDHLLWAVPDLERARRDLAQQTGVAPTTGGRHPGVGTWNALLDLGHRSYLEIIAPDPEQRGFTGLGRLLEGIDQPQLLTWCARTERIADLAEIAHAAGLGPGPVTSMERTRPDGSTLRWKILMFFGHDAGPLVPFFIEWGHAHHPTQDLDEGCRLERLELRHPDPDKVQTALAVLGLDSTVLLADHPGLAAHLATPQGTVVLESL